MVALYPVLLKFSNRFYVADLIKMVTQNSILLNSLSASLKLSLTESGKRLSLAFSNQPIFPTSMIKNISMLKIAILNLKISRIYFPISIIFKANFL